MCEKTKEFLLSDAGQDLLDIVADKSSLAKGELIRLICNDIEANPELTLDRAAVAGAILHQYNRGELVSLVIRMETETLDYDDILANCQQLG